jgi:alanine racemase
MVPGIPLLVLGALAPGEVDLAVSAETDISVWDPGFLASLAERAEAGGLTVGVHLKYDTGMGRLGCPDPAVVIEMARSVESSSNLSLEAVWTHFATADEPDPSFRNLQRDRLRELGERIRADFPRVKLHAANSAALIADPETHFDLVRPGVAVYGMDPFARDPSDHDLRPVLSLHSYVASVKELEPGMSVGYGRTWTADRPTRIATVPVGYGDGVRRALSNRGEVLIGGMRHPIAGTISMDNLAVAIGDGSEIRVGDGATLVGHQGEARITAEEVARTLGTINYEITCGISPRVPRQGTGDPGTAEVPLSPIPGEGA